MKHFIIKLVLGETVLQTLKVVAKDENQAGDWAFDFADRHFGTNENYELYFVGNPRHDILFKNVK